MKCLLVSIAFFLSASIAQAQFTTDPGRDSSGCLSCTTDGDSTSDDRVSDHDIVPVPTPSCPIMVPKEIACGSKEAKELPFNYVSDACPELNFTQTELPFKNTDACRFQNLTAMVTTVTCTKTTSVSCDPCRGEVCVGGGPTPPLTTGPN